MQLPTVAALALGLAASAAALSQDEVAIIRQIAPGSSSCDPSSTECRTAEQAAPRIFEGLQRYGIDHPNQQAAVIALMALESGEFAYKRNAFPGRPGQGTANMQMPIFNLAYAKSIPAVAPEVANITSVDGLSDDELNRILDLVTVDEYNFASGPWFLQAECGEQTLSALEQNIDSGFEAYMACVGVTVDEARQGYLDDAKAAFGLGQ